MVSFRTFYKNGQFLPRFIFLLLLLNGVERHEVVSVPLI
jgi:hypothetical protein